MKKPVVLFCHGLESGPHGSKYFALHKAGYEVLAPDCTGMVLKKRIAVYAPIMKDQRPFVVGSSYGGLAAVLAAQEAGVELPGLVLCAPALERIEPPNTDPTLLPRVGRTTIIHGVADDVVSIMGSRRYAFRTGTDLVEVEDGHRLNKSTDIILAELAKLVG